MVAGRSPRKRRQVGNRPRATMYGHCGAVWIIGARQVSKALQVPILKPDERTKEKGGVHDSAFPLFWNAALNETDHESE